MSYQIISGINQIHYHKIPSELDLITTTPTREGIFKYLSQIGYDKFPEFILDILLKIEGHTAIDVTDGQGDEKQDILTLNRKGERCLTQCKHTVDYKEHYSGDNLDYMVAACMRKDAKQAIFVTNSDLTPQGKKYITDKEYVRGFQNPADCPAIEYWNGFIIWEKIKNNSDIINKWFSGLGQVHGLRSFKFDLTIQELPYMKAKNTPNQAFENIIDSFSSKPWIKEITKGFDYKADISKEYSVRLKRLDINFSLPEKDISFYNSPMYALTAEVEMGSDREQYSPVKVKDEIIKTLCDGLLPELTEGTWWHITASRVKSFIYLHDISEPREINLSSAATYVKTNSALCESEYLYCSLPLKDFDFLDEDEDSVWVDKKTGTSIVQMFEQAIDPIELFNYQVHQHYLLKKMESYDFYALENVDSSLMMRVRRLLLPEWTAFQHNETALIWAIPPDFDKKIVEACHNKLESIGIKVLLVKPEDRKGIVENVKTDFIPAITTWVSDINGISYPVELKKRIFWLSKKIEIYEPIDMGKEMKLLEFKFGFEKLHGFDYMDGKNEQRISSLEMKNILFDFFTFRGSRMLDISHNNKFISINIRFSEYSTKSSKDIVSDILKKFEDTYAEITSLLK